MIVEKISHSHSSTSPWKGEVGREAAGRGSKSSRFARSALMTKRAQRLRKNLTDAEAKLWRALRRNQIAGFGFRRQHAVGNYVLDFYCPALGLAIEVDGGRHNEESKRALDERRTHWLRSKGISVVRFWNHDVMTNFDGVLTEIVRKIDASSSRRTTPSLTLPLSGGGKSTGGR